MNDTANRSRKKREYLGPAPASWTMKGAKTIKLGQSGVRLFVQVFGGSIVGLGGERHVRVKR